MLRRGKKSSRRVTPEPSNVNAVRSAGNEGSPTSSESEKKSLQDTVEVQAQAIREMTTSLEQASKMMEKQSDAFTTDIEALQDTKSKLEARVKELEAQATNGVSEPSPPSKPTTNLPACPDPVEAAEMMIELDDIIMTVKQKGASKSLPSIIKHVITLFRLFFPTQLIELVVLDTYTKGQFWSMECRTDANSEIQFFDNSGEDLTAQSELFADVVSQRSIALIKDGAYGGDSSLGTLATPSANAVRGWLEHENSRVSPGFAKSGLLVPFFDQHDSEKSKPSVLGLLHMVNRMDEKGNVVNFGITDVKLLRLLVVRCSKIFMHTRTLTGILSTSRQRFGSFDRILGKHKMNSSEVKQRQMSLEQQMSQTREWLKAKLAHREYKIIFCQLNPAAQRKLDGFVVTLRALCKFLKTLARLRNKHREATMITRRNSLLTNLNAVQVLSFEFDEFSVSDHLLEEHAYNILDMHGIITNLHTPPDRLKLFIKRVRDAYLDNPYHSWKHGFMVMRTASMLIGSCPFIKLAKPEMCAFAIAGMCHDIAHPGKNNSFEQKIQSELAIRYNDKSIYENMHAATTFEILSDPAADVFATLTIEKKKELRKMMIQSILMTDMASHFDLAKKLESKVCAEGGVEQAFKASEDPEDKQLILDLILHSADIGAQTLPLKIANKWSYAVLEEFQLVHKAEKEANVELTPFIIGLHEPLRAANCQLGFISFIVKPLWTNLLHLIPEHKETLLKNLNQNIAFWKDEVDKHTVVEKSTENNEGSKGDNKESSDNNDDVQNLDEKTEGSSKVTDSGNNQENKQDDGEVNLAPTEAAN